MVDLTRAAPGSGPIITHIGPHGYRTQTTRFSGGVLLTPQSACAWDAPNIAELTELLLGDAVCLAPLPEFLLLGTGTTLIHPPPALRLALEARDIGLEVMDSAAAARAWGVLRAEGRWISAALYAL